MCVTLSFAPTMPNVGSKCRTAAVCPLAFVAGPLQSHWWGFISRNYVVWPIFFLMYVFVALKGTHFLFLSRFSKFGLKKQQLHLVLKKNAEVGFLGSISQTRRKCIYDRWTTGARGGGGGRRHSDFSMVSMCLPFWKPVRLDWNWGIIHECSRTYRNNAILSFDFIICQSEQFTIAIRLILAI